MADWQPIETLPERHKDGRVVRVKRVYEGRVIAEGDAVFDLLDEYAPGRSGPGLDPLGRLSAADYEREARQRAEWVSAKMWLRPDRMYCFPEPTHWMDVPANPLTNPQQVEP